MDYYRGHERRLTPHHNDHHYHGYTGQRPPYQHNQVRNDYKNYRHHYSDHYRSSGSDRHCTSDGRSRRMYHGNFDLPDRCHHVGYRRHNHQFPRQARSPDHGHFHDMEVFRQPIRSKPFQDHDHFWDLPLTQVYTQEDYAYNGPLFRKKRRDDHRMYRSQYVDSRLFDIEEKVIDVFVYFVYAKWCRLSTILKPYVKKLGEKYRHKISTKIIDADANQDFIKMHDISDVPTVIVFVGDIEAYRVVKGGVDEIVKLYSIYNDLKLHH